MEFGIIVFGTFFVRVDCCGGLLANGAVVAGKLSD